MATSQGGYVNGGFDLLKAPDAPTITSVTTDIGTMSVAFTAPANPGGSAVTGYTVTAINESTGASVGATGSASPISVPITVGGTFKVRTAAANIYGPGRVSAFDTGNAVYSGAELYAWGDADKGFLGDGTVVGKSSPVQVGALTNWADISTGLQHVLSVKTDGTLWAWGYGNGGRLGNNSTNDRSSPIQVGALTNWSQVSGGKYTSSAVKTDGTLWTWGRRDQGQLGNNQSSIDGTSINSPIQIGSDTNWQSVAMAGNGRHTLAIKTTGSLWSWGLGNNGQLGQGNVISRSSPVQVGSLTNWSQVSGGGYHTAAVKTDNTLWAWGYNTFGQLGQNNTIRRSSPVQVGALVNWASVCASRLGCLAVKTDGTLWSWGQNSQGQLGLGDTIDRSSPVQIGALTNWFRVPENGGINAGLNFGAVKTDGTLWLWGDGGFGQLGQNGTVDSSSPVQVGALTTWYKFSLGNLSVIATIGVT